MRWLSAAARELIGLFIDDGTLALALLVWVAAMAVLLPLMPGGTRWGAAVLPAGIIAILVENVLRAAAAAAAAAGRRRSR